jgi:endonuclease/exonuclease/phosphatase family metal-dependent hydrolase
MFRILTLNMLGFSADCPDDNDERKRTIVKKIEEDGADVVLLQEIKTRYGGKDGTSCCTERFFRESVMFQHHTRVVYGDQRAASCEGVGILSRHDIIREQYGPLPPCIFGRAYMLLLVNLSEQPLYVMTFHLAAPAIGRMITQYGAQHERQEKARAQELEAIADLVCSLDPAIPLFIGGDFNVESDNPLYSEWQSKLGLSEVFADTRDFPRKTFATHRSPSFDFGMELRLDHLLYRQGGGVGIRIVKEGIVFNKQVTDENRFFYGFLSDHVGLFADFEFY